MKLILIHGAYLTSRPWLPLLWISICIRITRILTRSHVVYCSIFYTGSSWSNRFTDRCPRVDILLLFLSRTIWDGLELTFWYENLPSPRVHAYVSKLTNLTRKWKHVPLRLTLVTLLTAILIYRRYAKMRIVYCACVRSELTN